MNYDKKLISNVKGFIDEEEGQYLYDIAFEASKMGPCLEIGSYCGKSAIYLGSACRKNNSILFSIDHHHGSEEQQPGEEYFDPELYNHQTDRIDTCTIFRQVIEKFNLGNTVIPIISRSEIIARLWATPLSLVFIDGGHAFETVHTDYKCWYKHIKPEGYLLIHDIFKDPNKGGQAPYTVYQIAARSGLFRELPMIKSMGALQRL